MSSDGTACAVLSFVMLSTKTILIVEDNEDWSALLTMVLKRSGYDVVVAGTGKEGFEQAVAKHPALILMDLGLPEMSGDEATVRIKSDPRTRDIPIVIQTAFGVGPQAQRAMQSGATEIIHKPVNITAVQSTVEKYLPNENPVGSSLL